MTRNPAALFPLLAAAAIAQQPAEWRRVPYLTGRTEHAMAYDSQRERTVLFGGRIDHAEHTNGDTFEYDGQTWSLRRPRHSPAARRGHGLAFDRTRGRVVLFGGRSGPTWFRDTWEYDGVDWQVLPTSPAPSVREGPAMAFDSARQVVLAYGGAWDRDLFWQWDGTTWSPLPSPVGLLVHHLTCGAFDEVRERFVVNGGFVATTRNPQLQGTQDTREWDGVAWVHCQPATSPNNQNYPSSMVYDVARRRCVLRPNGFGNWEWDGRDWSLTALSTSPDIVDRSVLVYDCARARIVAFGGQGNGRRRAETWEYDSNSWTQCGDEMPTSGVWVALLPDPQRAVLELWTELAAWQWNGARWAPMPAATQPSRRHTPSFARDEARSEVMCFGGFDGNLQLTNETWIWNGATWQRRFPAQSPPPSLGPLCYDPLRGRIALFADPGSVWEWDGVTWWNVIPPIQPPPRFETTVAFDPALGGIMLHGGMSRSTFLELTDSWCWNGVTWQGVSGSGPVLARPRTMASDPVRRRIVTIGITAGIERVWEWDGTSWLPQREPQRSLPGSPRATWDPAQQRVVLVSLDESGEVWSYGSHVAAEAHAFGSACGGPLGAPALTCAAPQLGNAGFTLDLLHAPPFAPCAIGIAVGPRNLALGAGCTTYLPPSFAPSVAMGNAHGFASMRMPLPVDPTLRGLRFVAQGLALDPTAPLGVGLTAGLYLTLGD